MEGGIDAETPLDYAAFQIFPAQNRYEAAVCKSNHVEKLVDGVLEQLASHLPSVKELSCKDSIGNLKLNLTENLMGASWFTKSTITRFLHIVASPDLLSDINAVENEIFQLEEARKFHLSLYSKGHPDHFGTGDSDGWNSSDKSSTSRREDQTLSSDASRNELLRAMDLRLMALIEKLEASFNQAIGATCSIKEIGDLEKISEYLGAKKLRTSLCKVLEHGQKSQIVDLSDVGDFSHACNLKKDSANGTDSNTQTSKFRHSCNPVQYSVSPAKAAQLERQILTESDESSYSDDEAQTSMERSRTLTRSTAPRRSASPLRRVQIGKTGSRRTTALAIKSLNFFPGRERTNSYRDDVADSSEVEGSGQSHTNCEKDIRRMSVQDAISLFESKQKDQSACAQKLRSSTDSTLATNKSVLKRWSMGMGGPSANCSPKIDSENIVEGDITNDSKEVKLESEFIPGGSDHLEATEVDIVTESLENSSSNPVETKADSAANQGDDDLNERLAASAEWNHQKEVELKSMMMQIIESKPVKHRRVVPECRGNQQPSSGPRSKFHDQKGKRDKKLQGEKTGNRPDNDAHPIAVKQFLGQNKMSQMVSDSNVGKELNPVKPRKSQNNISLSAKPSKESLKPGGTKKKLSKDSSLPGRRNSWPSAPLRKNIASSPARNPGGVSSVGLKVTRQKPQAPQSLPQSVGKVEKQQQPQKKAKVTQSHPNKSSKMNVKKQDIVTKGGKTTKSIARTPPDDYSSMVPADSSFSSRMTKKSSVVPLESKPYLRKGSGISPRVGPPSGSTKVSSPPKESPIKSENMVQAQEGELVSDSPATEHQRESNLMAPEILGAVLDSESQAKEDEIDNESNIHDEDKIDNESNIHDEDKIDNESNIHDEDKIDEVILDGDDTYQHVGNSQLDIQPEAESVISPSAWVEIEEEEEPRPSVPCDDSASQLASPVVLPEGASCPHIRQSLSQMLQEESSEEPDVVEWGNAENPPLLVFQKDSPKGLKRLLKFARKSKGDANTSTFSEGEDDAEESKASFRKHADSFLRKSAPHAKDFVQQKTLLRKSYDGTQSSMEGHVSAAATAAKASRSFFSLSAFRGSKPSDTKLR